MLGHLSKYNYSYKSSCFTYLCFNEKEKGIKSTVDYITEIDGNKLSYVDNEGNISLVISNRA